MDFILLTVQNDGTRCFGYNPRTFLDLPDMLWVLTLLKSIVPPRLSDDGVKHTQGSIKAMLKVQKMDVCDAGIKRSGPLGGM